jgi:hypothetical protein
MLLNTSRERLMADVSVKCEWRPGSNRRQRQLKSKQFARAGSFRLGVGLDGLGLLRTRLLRLG